MTPLPPLNALRVFDAVVRTGSFAKAAASLNMTRAAVGYQIRLLEDRLGTPLFDRTVTGVKPTAAGEQLSPRVAVGLRELRGALEDLEKAAVPELAVSAVTNFGQQWLMPRLGRCQQELGMRIRLETTASLTDVNRGGFDVAIRNGYGSWPGLKADRLISLSVTPLVAPTWLAVLGAKPDPDAILKLPLYCMYQREWAAWLDEAGAAPERLGKADIHEWDCWHLIGQAVINGLGAGLLFPFLYQPELADGSLLRPFETEVAMPYGYWLAYAEDRAGDPRIRAFSDWLTKAIAEAV